MSLVPRNTFDDNPLGLSSRYSMSKEVRRARDEEIGRSVARTQVIAADMAGIVKAVEVSVLASAQITKIAEAAAVAMPYERHRTDALAEMGVAMLQVKLRELGGQ